jgi:putative methanogenesis marker protein 8
MYSEGNEKVKNETLFRLLDIEKKHYSDLHIVRLFSAFVAITEGKVLKMTEPVMTYCPLARHMYRHLDVPSHPVREEIQALIAQGVSEKIEKFGFFTEKRELAKRSIAIPYGASEMLMYALRKKIIDAAVVVCDGAGSVIVQSPDVVQGIGARMNGLFYTTPIPKLRQRLEGLGCHVPFADGTIDQAGASEKAARLGFKNIAVTINSCTDEPIAQFAEIEKKFGVSVTTFMVCATGVEKQRIQEMTRHSDVVWSCASGEVRETVGKSAVLQITRKIPVFVLTKKGLSVVSGYCGDETLLRNLDTGRQYFIAGDCGGRKITMGRFKTYLREENLPVRSPDEPRFSM